MTDLPSDIDVDEQDDQDRANDDQRSSDTGGSTFEGGERHAGFEGNQGVDATQSQGAAHASVFLGTGTTTAGHNDEDGANDDRRSSDTGGSTFEGIERDGGFDGNQDVDADQSQSAAQGSVFLGTGTTTAGGSDAGQQRVSAGEGDHARQYLVESIGQGDVENTLQDTFSGANVQGYVQDTFGSTGGVDRSGPAPASELNAPPVTVPLPSLVDPGAMPPPLDPPQNPFGAVGQGGPRTPDEVRTPEPYDGLGGVTLPNQARENPIPVNIQPLAGAQQQPADQTGQRPANENNEPLPPDAPDATDTPLRAEANRITFPPGQSALTGGAIDKWIRGLSVADQLRLVDGRHRLEVVGHASRTGTSEARERMAADRANAVATALIASGITAEISGGGAADREALARGHREGLDDSADRSVSIRIVPIDSGSGERSALADNEVGFDRGSSRPSDDAVRALFERYREDLQNRRVVIEVVGHASRLGSAERNESLASERATEVAGRLIELGATAQIRGGGMGEAEAQARGHLDGTDNPLDRTVTIIVRRDDADQLARVDPTRTVPRVTDERADGSANQPADLTRVDPGPPAPSTDGRGDRSADQPADVRETMSNLPQFDREALRTDPADRVNQVLDVTGAMVGSVTLFIESWGAELAGLALGAASPFLTLGVAWLRGDDLARWNGRVQGFTDAIEQMSRAYADPALDQQPLNSWPPLPRPEAGPIDDAAPIAEIARRQGEREGFELANRWIRSYREIVTVRGQDGQMHRVQSNPYLFLRGLAARYYRPGEAARALQDELNRQMTARGGPTWPRLR